MDQRTAYSGREETRKCPYCCELIHADAVKCRYCRSTLDPPDAPVRAGDLPAGKMFLGVCTRLAARYQMPATPVRVAFVLLTLFHGFGILLYLILWALLPGPDEREEPKAGHWMRTLRGFFRAVKRAFAEEMADARGAGTGGSGADKAGDVKAVESL